MFRAYCHKCEVSVDQEEISSVAPHRLPVGPSAGRGRGKYGQFMEVPEARTVSAICACGVLASFVLSSRDTTRVRDGTDSALQ